jgi:hypothetical protein
VPDQLAFPVGHGGVAGDFASALQAPEFNAETGPSNLLGLFSFPTPVNFGRGSGAATHLSADGPLTCRPFGCLPMLRPCVALAFSGSVFRRRSAGVVTTPCGLDHTGTQLRDHCAALDRPVCHWSAGTAEIRHLPSLSAKIHARSARNCRSAEAGQQRERVQIRKTAWDCLEICGSGRRHT